jgi:hypothetical protein
MKTKTFVSAVILLTGASVGAEQMKPRGPKEDARAAALMQEAAKSRYTWSPDVTVVSFRFTWARDGKSGSGTFRSEIHKRAGSTYSPEGSEALPEEVREHINSMIMHRTPPRHESAQRPAGSFAVLVEGDDRGPLLMTRGDAMLSTQRVKDGRMVQVNRTMGGKRFTIDVTRFEKTSDGRYYPADFTVTWWDAATGKKLEKQTYSTEGLYSVDGQMFPKAEKVVSDKSGKTSELAIRYSDVKVESGAHKQARK